MKYRNTISSIFYIWMFLANCSYAYDSGSLWSKPAGLGKYGPVFSGTNPKFVWTENAMWNNITSTGKEDGCLWKWQNVDINDPYTICYASFAILSDVHSRWTPSTDINKTQGVNNVMEWLSSSHEDYNASKLKFVLFNGDIVDWGKASAYHLETPSLYPDDKYEKFIDVMDNYNIPWIPVMGNHDIFTEYRTYLNPSEPVTTDCELDFWKEFKDNYPYSGSTHNFPVGENWSMDGTGISRCGIYQVTGNSESEDEDHKFTFTNGGFDIPVTYYVMFRDKWLPYHVKWHFIYADFLSRIYQNYFCYNSQNWPREAIPLDHTKWGTLLWLSQYELKRVKAQILFKNVILITHNIYGYSSTFSNEVENVLLPYKNNMSLVILGHSNAPSTYSARDCQGICPFWTADNFGQWLPEYGSMGIPSDFTPTRDDLTWDGPINNRRFIVVELCGKNGGEVYPLGCANIQPKVYPWNSNQFVEDNTILPSNRFGLAWDDFYKLETPLQLKNGKCIFRIYGNTGGNSYLDQIRLVAIDHSDITVISATPYGEIMHHAQEEIPITCVSDSGIDVKSLISYNDTEYERIPAGGYVEANFGNVTDSAYSCVSITGENTTNIPLIITCGNDSVATIFPREKPSVNFIDLTGCKGGGTGDLVLRLTAVGDSGVATINMFSYCTRVPQSAPAKPTGDIEVYHCELESASRYDTSGSNPRDVTDELSYQDGMSAGFESENYVEFQYTPPESALKSGYSREYIVVSSGECTPVPSVDTIGPEISVIYPNGSEKFAIGDTYSISFYGCDNVIVDSVQLSLIYNYETTGCDTYYLGSLYPQEPAGKWSKDCIIPSYLAPSNACRILAVGYDRVDNNNSDISDNNFSLVKGKDHHGRNWVITQDSVVYGLHWDIDTFKVNSGVTASVLPYNGSDTSGLISVESQTMLIPGTLKGDSAGYNSGEGDGAGVMGSSMHGGSGAGFGGRGGYGGSNVQGDTTQYGGYAYGDSILIMGSGGGNSDPTLWGKGGRGGAIIKLICSGTATINGTIRSNGKAGTGSDGKVAGGGSGGSILLQTSSLAGTGIISAKGGDGASGTNCAGGGGAGGRIHIKYGNSTYAGRIDISGGTGLDNAIDGQPGTALVQSISYQGETKNVALLSPVNTATNSDSKEGFIKGVELTDSWIRLSTNDSIVGNIELSTGDSIIINSSSHIIANSKGFAHNQGAGYGHAGSSSHGGGGAGYGGIGGHGNYYTPNGTGDGGIAYGDYSHPDSLGSGGGDYGTGSGYRWGGGTGGGKVILDCATGKVLINGTISVNGANGISKTSYASGGGSGGSVLIYAKYLFGSGTINAKGGDGGSVSNCKGGGGAGGRVCLYRDSTNFDSTHILVTGGLKGGTGATDGDTGTIYIDVLPSGGGGGQGSMTKPPLIFKLYQNYPNPSLKQTTLMYSIPVPSKVSLKLYDLSGRCVKTFVDGEKLPGYYKETLNAKDYPTGVYFAKFKAGNYKETRKLVLMK